MQTYSTLSAARQAADSQTTAIIEIDHAEHGRCYIRVRCPMATLAKALESKPMPEIKRLVAEHSVKTEEQIEAERQHILQHECRCERCRMHVDGRTAYSQQEWTRFGGQRVKVAAYYCDACKALLQAIGAGEYTAMQERAGEVEPHEHAHKQDW